MEEKGFRNKIYWFTFFLSILVVWVHASNSELFLGRTAAAATVSRMEHFIGYTVAQIAVPGFFMISAYLFYRNFTWKKLSEKWLSRVRSILVPFILWNGIYYLGYVLASRLPFVTDVVGKGSVPFHFLAAVDAVLHYTYNYVFWYLYQLILLILLTPVIYFVLKQKYIGVCVLGILFFLVQKGILIPLLNLDALLYYSFAAFCGIHLRGAVEGPWERKRAFTGLGIFLGIWLYYGTTGGERLAAIVALRILALPALWLMVNQAWLKPAPDWAVHNFFLYATHFAMVRLINKTAAMVLPESMPLPLLLYILMPVLVVCLSYQLGRLLRRISPACWSLLNGGRS